MKTKKLNQQVFINVIKDSKDYATAVLNLYCLVIDDAWEDIESFNSYPQCNKTTASFILNLLTTKFPDDAVAINMLWLQKGFSSFHEDLGDFQVRLPNNCYTLCVDSVKIATIEDFTGAYAQVEVEEAGEEPDYDGAGFHINDRGPDPDIDSDGDWGKR